MNDLAHASLGAIPTRAVTAEEIAFYRDNGWVQLKGFVARETVQQILKNAHKRMGVDGDSNEVLDAVPNGEEKKIAFFNAEHGGGMATPGMREYLHGVGRAAKALMERRRAVEVQLLADTYVVKLPSAAKTKHYGNGPTAFHQDYINFCLDRSGGMTFWLALEDYGPEFGTMSFISGSHRLGVLGNFRTYQPGEDLRDIYPEFRDEMLPSEPTTYEVGDVTVHSYMTVHGAGLNVSDRPRWGYLAQVQPADTCWTGAPAEAYDCSGMGLNMPFPEDRFPVISR